MGEIRDHLAHVATVNFWGQIVYGRDDLEDISEPPC